MATKDVIKARNSAELLSYIINADPILRAEVDLPVQGQDIKEIGKLIVNNERYKNAFLNTVNLIGLTVIKRNGWNNPWDFTKRGTLRFGQQVRELINDLAPVYDYNELSEDVTRFLENQVPDLYNYIHEVNFQKFYETTTSDVQMAMAFENEESLLVYIDETIGMLYQSLMYDEYLVDKYILCRRIVEGTVTPTYIPDFDNLTVRERVAYMKGASNKMSFRSPNYNPAGIRRATAHENQIFILNCEFDAQVTTEVLATSFFRNDAEFKSRGKLIDTFSDTDDARLIELLGDAYTPFTEEEKAKLGNIPAVIISEEWFMDYDYALDGESGQRYTEFYNPTTLKNNHFLHYWGVKSSSPFENATVFTTDEPSVVSVAFDPSEITTSKGQTVQLKVNVETTGFANKGVSFESSVETIKVSQDGKVVIPSDTTETSVTITATSIFDNTKSATATITIA